MKLIWASFVYIFTCIFSCYNNMHFVSSLCLDHQKSLLLGFKNTLEFNQSLSAKLVTWNESTDCCLWGGIACDPSNGQVISLNLTTEGITSVGSFSSLFQMEMASLTSLDLSNNYFDAILPNSIGNLKRLRHLDLWDNNFYGIIPSSIGNLSQLEYLDLSSNNFFGPIPSFSSSKNLIKLYLNDNKLNGSIKSTNWEGLLHLEILHLESNLLTGNIPGSLFSAPSLREIILFENKFSGQLHELENTSSSKLIALHLGSNNLEGPIPKSISQLRALEELGLYGNRFNGTLHLNEILGPLKNLTYLCLSNNWLSIDTSGGTSASTNSSFPQLRYLRLGSCNLGALPHEFLKTQSRLEILDLSNNHIQGTLPTWIWNTSTHLEYVNLSVNNFVHLEQPIPSSSLYYVDLHSNNIQGELPSLPFEQLRYLDLSSNGFTSINPGFGSNLYKDFFFFLSLARNDIYGRIPASLCNATSLEILDLEANNFQGTIPDCLIALNSSFSVLSVKGNNLSGVVPDNFEKGCMLQTLDLNGNLLQGSIPRSLAHCYGLRVLDLGNNLFNVTFPCQLKTLSRLQVLVLRSNKLSGSIECLKDNSIWPLLQILDLACNHFSGELKPQYICHWTSMMAATIGVTSQPGLLEYISQPTGGVLYQDTVTLTFKGSAFKLQKILRIFTTIDLSSNAFHGEMPQELGNLNGLIVLNLSHNFLSGNIPSSLGNLSQLESLDLSCNKLSGHIPQELAKLSFLEYLNLSYNKLEGLIPTSTQLQSFNASSYEGNPGLYGQPLTPSSTAKHTPGLTPPVSLDRSHWSSKSELEWMLGGAEVGFPVGLTIFIGPLLYIRRWRRWYCWHLERLVMKILRKEDAAEGRIRRRTLRQQQQRR